MTYLNSDIFTGILDSYSNGRIGGWARQDIHTGYLIVVWINNGVITKATYACLSRLDLQGTFGFFFDEIEDVDIRSLYTKSITLAAYTPDEISQIANKELNLPCEINQQDYQYRSFELSCKLKDLVIHDTPKKIIRIYENIILDYILKNFDIEKLRRRLIRSEKFRDGEPMPSKFDLEVGCISFDGSTIVGKNGNLFLHSGTNMLIGLYELGIEESRRIAEKWLEIIQIRKQKCDQIGVKFFQIIIPEKTSILCDLYPRLICEKTPFLKILEELILKHGASRYSMSLHNLFFNHANKYKLFRKIDSHLSIQGCDITSEFLIKLFGDNRKFNFHHSHLYQFQGDLASRFIGLIEFMYGPSPHTCESNMKCIKSFDPPNGHQGITRVFKNNEAPIKKKIIIFGNSFMGKAEEPHELSWWFARAYRDFHFVWSNEVDFDYINFEKPDLVVAQNIERFLPVIPSK
jgi:hypothetical protein